MLKKETFNLYASFKRRNIGMEHGDARLLRLLISKELVFAGTSSLTLVSVNDVSQFVDDAHVEIVRRRTNQKNVGKRERKEDDVQLSEGADILRRLASAVE